MSYKFGTPGNDALFTQASQAGETAVFGWSGNDSMLGVVHDLGQESYLSLFGGSGDDTLIGFIALRPNEGPMESNSFISLFGGSGDDHLFAMSGYLLLDGGSGDDYLWSFHGSEMDGGAGDDTIMGGGSSDDPDDYNVIDGGSGQDFIMCGPVGDQVVTDDGEADFVVGGDGDDAFYADLSDCLTGGLGADRFSFSMELTDYLVEGVSEITLGGVIADFTADEGDLLSMDLGDLSQLHPQAKIEGNSLVVSTNLGRVTFDLDGLVGSDVRLVVETDDLTDFEGHIIGSETTVGIVLVGLADPWATFLYQQYSESSPIF